MPEIIELIGYEKVTVFRSWIGGNENGIGKLVFRVQRFNSNI